MTPEQLKLARQFADLTQTQVGEIFGYSRQAIYAMEAGTRPIPFSASMWRSKVAKYLHQRARDVAKNATLRIVDADKTGGMR